MGEPDRRVSVLFDKQTAWQGEMAALRRILLASPVTEAFKWRSAVYTAHGGNVAILWRLKAHCGLGFFKGVLLDDPQGLLVAPGENSRSARMIPFTSVAEVEAKETVLKEYIARAVAIQKAGLKVDFPKDDLEMPEELSARLEVDPELKAAFDALTPGRRRGYILQISGAKQSKTREARIDKWAPRILDGKGMHDR